MRFEFATAVVHVLGYAASGSLIALAACSEIAGIDAIPCTPGCKDETTRILCDAAGKARTEACPTSKEACAAPACEAGVCTFKPAVGAPCGETGAAQCNEGFACLGTDFALSALYRHTCLRADDGKVWCWGDNTYHQLGDGTDKPGLHPVLVSGLPGPATHVLTGYGHTCAVLAKGEAYCWGNNRHGQCGVSPSVAISAPVRVPAPGIQFILVQPGDEHTCALTLEKTIYCWGNTEHGQCGSDPELTGLSIVGPTKVPDLDNVNAFVLVKNHTCAARSEEPTMMCWGSNSNVQLPERSYVNGKLGPAAGDLPYSASPKPVDVGSAVFYVGMGAEATYALTRSGLLYAWGENDRLQLGIESREKIVRTPTSVKIETSTGLVPLARAFIALRSTGSDHCVGVEDRTDFDTSYLCWGTDDWGELGVGTEEAARATHPYPVPVRAVPSTATNLMRGEDHACASVLVGGRPEIRCYGRAGMLGDGSPRAENDDAPSRWQARPVVWEPDNFGSALE
jgi:alpha-tubulin suppressor-like RCC1 family protein